MAKIHLIIEIGSSNTYIYKIGSGLVLVEPSLVATKFGQKDLFAVGHDAKKLYGKTNDAITFVSPIKSGVVDNKKLAIIMFEKFIEKIVPKKTFLGSIDALMCISNGLSESEESDFKEILYACNIGNVTTVSSSIVSLIGAGINTSNSRAVISVNVGGGITDFAVVGLNDIVAGFSINFGGNDMDDAIRQFIFNLKGLEISRQSAEKFKNECLSLYENDTSNMEINGIDIVTNKPCSEVVSSFEIRVSVLHFFENICSSIEHLINLCSPEIVADLMSNGIVITGGVANISGLENYITKKLNIPCFVPNSPEQCTALGGAKYYLEFLNR